jgi:hypothetical protein
MTDAKNLNVSRKIDPLDQMWESGPDWYFQVGQSGLDVVKKILTLSWSQALADEENVLVKSCAANARSR